MRTLNENIELVHRQPAIAGLILESVSQMLQVITQHWGRQEGTSDQEVKDMTQTARLRGLVEEIEKAREADWSLLTLGTVK